MKLVFTTQLSARKGNNILSNSASSGFGTDYVNPISVIVSGPLFSLHRLLPLLIFFALAKNRKIPTPFFALLLTVNLRFVAWYICGDILDTCEHHP